LQISWSLFPKFFSHLSLPALAELVREVGLDTTNLVVRDGFQVTPEYMAEELPLFLRIMRREGLEIRFATTDYQAETLIAQPEILSTLADAGIRDFRIGHFPDRGGDVRQALRQVREALQRLVPLCEKAGIRAVTQLHNNTLIASPGMAYHLFHDLPPEWMGIELDPGNQSYDGLEEWDRSARLLGSSVVALGVKDTGMIRDMGRAEGSEKGWVRYWTPIDNGVTQWHQVIRALHKIDFAGTFVFMPFYDPDDPAEMRRRLREEVAYLRRIVTAVMAEAEK
jgi:sugar phosphate isomerase/epimerase